MKTSIKVIPNAGYPLDYWKANTTHILLTPVETSSLQAYRTEAATSTSLTKDIYTKTGKTANNNWSNSIGIYSPDPSFAITTTACLYHEFTYWKMAIGNIACMNPYPVAENSNIQTNSGYFTRKPGGANVSLTYKANPDLLANQSHPEYSDPSGNSQPV